MGKEYWRSLEDLADSQELRTLVENEFPALAEDLVDPATRRDFLKVLGASLGMLTLTGCRWPKELIVPFASRPEDRIPGVAQYFATAFERGGTAVGLLVKSVDGRPLKVEGNPLHPISLGAADQFAQASVLEMYDPDRKRQGLRRQQGLVQGASWDDFSSFAAPHFSALRSSGGQGLAVLTQASSSPTFAALSSRFRERFPAAGWYEWEPLSRDNERAGTAAVFGVPARPQLLLDRAAVIVALDDDFLAMHPAALRHARDFARTRRAADGRMSRLHVAECTPSVTGGAADHRLALPAAQVPSLAAALLRELGGRGVALGDGAALRGAGGEPELGEKALAFVRRAAADLAAARGRGVITAGPRQAPAVHALVAALNGALGNSGATVVYLDDPQPERAPHVASIRALAAAIEAGGIDTLLVLGGNPAFDAPAELGFAAALDKVPHTISLSLFEDETAMRCAWSLPRAHGLEAWGDARAWDGTVSIVQPLIQPLYGGRTEAELLAMVLGEPASGHDLVRSTFARALGGAASEASWQEALRDGIVRGSAPTATARRASWSPALGAALAQAATAGAAESSLEAVFIADASVWDGRFANNAWLQELPRPLSLLTWDNAALIAPATARDLGIGHGDLVRIGIGGREIEIAAFVMPGQAPGSVALPLGYGRTAAGRVGNDVGFNVYAVRSSDALDVAQGVSLRASGGRYRLATTQEHHAIDESVAHQGVNRRLGWLVREGTLAEFLANPQFAEAKGPVLHPAPVFEELEYEGAHQWAMAIDLSACIGCNACMVACQAENNIPVVGKKQVARSREMHWIRVDRYFSGGIDDPGLSFQPMLCQHCENAPCEEVCPVAATVHSHEGLNQMVYNRCVGTRYCSNNCPYKVRRFNFFNYVRDLPQVRKMAFNPDVTVRGRGVMEKCTFCIQRIEAGKIAAKNERRPLRDGEIVPACAQTCPTRAIVFGDISNPQSEVARLHEHPRGYSLLADLNTKPRLRYLARLRNPAEQATAAPTPASHEEAS